MITTQVNISYERQTVPPIVPAVQGDSGRNILCNLTDYTIPTGATANFYIQKPSGEAIYNVAEISGNTVILPLDAQCLAEIGENHLQVRVFLNGEVITSFEIILLVKKFYGMDAIESETEMNIFDKAVEEAVEEIESAKEQAIAEISEGIDTTLTQAGKAADAKAVGDRFAETDTDIAAINDELENIVEPYGTGRSGYLVGNIYEKDGELYVAQVTRVSLEPIEFTESDFYTATLSQIAAGNAQSLALPYDKTATYNTGDLTVYLGKLKQCKADGVTGEFDYSKWNDVTFQKLIYDQKTEIDAELSSVKNNLLQLDSRVDAIEEGGTGGLTAEFKSALDSFTASVLNLADYVAYSSVNGQTLVNAISSAKSQVHNAMYSGDVPVPAVSVTLNPNTISWNALGSSQRITATVLPADTTDTVTWTSSDTSIATVSSDGVVTGVSYGTATITATAGNVSATCSVSIADIQLLSISAAYTQTTEVHPTTALNDLKSDLVVTATYSDSTTAIISGDNYALSGTLEVGTSVITVTYEGKTATFNVTVTEIVTPLWHWDFTNSLIDTVEGKEMTLSSTNPPVRNNTGLVFSGSVYPEWAEAEGILVPNRTFIIDVVSMNVSDTAKNNRVMSGVSNISMTDSADEGFMYNRNTGKWAFYTNGGWNVLTGDWTSNYTYFSGKKLKIYIDSSDKWSIYADDVFLGQSTYIRRQRSHLFLGGSPSSGSAATTTCAPAMTIKSLTVYEGEV